MTQLVEKGYTKSCNNHMYLLTNPSERQLGCRLSKATSNSDTFKGHVHHFILLQQIIVEMEISHYMTKEVSL